MEQQRLAPAAALAAAALLASASPAPRSSEVQFDDAVALTADGAIIDVGKDIGHAGPMLRDFDGDGKRDLLVSSFRGTIEFFRNKGTNDAPSYASKGKLQALGEKPGELKFHNW